ncbi:orc1/cdc6 family replication initiation protein [Candidatus Woesearchaeota archaeon]|nr:orc1/cdc6 family replication initiation protein [Candidatus Woesearchaeota archaeon]
MGDKLLTFFEEYRNNRKIFTNRKFLQINHEPEKILHREEQIQQIAKILAPLSKNEKPSNVFIYGKPGTGKTVSVKHIVKNLEQVAQKYNIPLTFLYVNCKLKKISDTEYRLIANLARLLGKAIPTTGLPTDEIYHLFYETIDKEPKQFVIVLDEIDQLVEKIGDDILYNLIRINTELKKAQLSVIGISNNVSFIDNLDPRIKSSLSEEEVVFSPYNAIQLQTILKDRADKAFVEGSVEEGFIEKCAAYAARDHGDARRAIELMRVSAEIAERKGQDKILIKNLDDAEGKIEKDRIFESIKIQPKQYNSLIYSIICLAENNNKGLYTGEIYELYQKICVKTQLRPLTQRRISDILAEFDTLGFIQAKIISKGRYGRTREIFFHHKHLTNELKKQLETSLFLEDGY